MSLMYIKCVSPSLKSAVSLDEVKLYLKIDHDFEDDLLRLFINAAIKKCEQYTEKALIKQDWTAVYEKSHCNHINLPITPVIKVLKILGEDYHGNSKAYSGELYRVKENRVDFFVIPMCYRLSITFTCGYADSSNDIPEELKSLLLEHIGHMYEYRSSNVSYNMEKYKNFRGIRV